jgi:hypothetical protein
MFLRVQAILSFLEHLLVLVHQDLLGFPVVLKVLAILGYQ